MTEQNRYDIDVIRNGFINVVVPNPQLIITHLKMFLYGAKINVTDKNEHYIKVYCESPVWRKETHYKAYIRFDLTKTETNEYKIFNIVETKED